MVQDIEWQKKTEDAMFSKNIRSDLMDEEDLADKLADERISELLSQSKVDFTSFAIDEPDSKIRSLDYVQEKFGNLINDISNDIREALVLAADARTNNADQSWKPLSLYDNAGTCPACGEYVRISALSNNIELVNNVSKNFEQNVLPNYNLKVDKDKRLFFKSDKKETIYINGQQESIEKVVIDWNVFRNYLTESGVKFNQKSGPMKVKEMLALYEANSDWGMIAAGLLLCSRDSLKCPGCKENLWNRRFKPDRPFHRIAYDATRIILEETIGSPVTRAPVHINGKLNGEQIEILIGKIDGNGGSTNKRLLAEAVLTATRVLGDVDISTNETFGEGNTKVQINKEDSEASSRIYVTPSHNIVTKLAVAIQKIRPIPAFVRDGRKVEDYLNWSSICAGQVLHAIHSSGLLFNIEKTNDYTYSSGSTAEHSTNLIRLNDEIKSRVLKSWIEVNADKQEEEHSFISEMLDGRTYNALESMLAKETTPPMVCKPVDRSLEKNTSRGQGGLLTKAGQKKYKLITQEPQYKAFGIQRFEPSQKAINAINVLQSTEWTIDTEMIELAKISLNEHVKDKILTNLQVRKAWQIRRHYFADQNETPLKMKNGENKIRIVKTVDSLEEAENIVNNKDSNWKTCSGEKKGRMKFEYWSEDYSEVYYLDFLDVKPALTFGQVNAWLNTFEFVERLRNRHGDGNVSFWHAWHFDWRGRIMPVSTMLSPQNDDFSRSIIKFANAEALNENGRKWMGRVVASMYHKQPIPQSIQGKEREDLRTLLNKLDSKTHEVHDEVSSNELFRKMLREIATNPMENFECWGSGDVFRTKAEGLQRIALIREFISVIDQGDNATTSLPLNLDASSSIYQHASALMLDKEMAGKVNVLPNNGGKPSDVYQEVVDHLEKKWKGNPFSKFTVNHSYEDSENKTKKTSYEVTGLDDEIAEQLKSKILVRNMAKKPVMTIGYGASSQNMVKTLLTDNGEDNGKSGGVFYFAIGENWPQKPEDSEKVSKSEFRRLMVAHPMSKLGQIFNKLKIPEHFHWLISQTIISGFAKSIEEVLPGYKKMKDTLTGSCKSLRESHLEQCTECNDLWNKHLSNPKNHPSESTDCQCKGEEYKANEKCTKNIKKDFMINSDEFLKCSGGLEWTVVDGSKVENIYLEDPTTKSIKAWGGIDNASKTIRNLARDELDETSKSLIPHDNLQPIAIDQLENLLSETTLDKLKQHELRKLTNLAQILETEGFSKDTIDENSLSVDWPSLAKEIGCGNTLNQILEFEADEDSSEATDKIVTSVRKFSGTYNSYFSRHVLSNKRDIGGERRGIAPNFIHSLDACHMRLVVNALSRNGVKDIWSVHDAFGCHPNYIEDLRYIVNQTFVEVHKADEQGRGPLSRLFYDVSSNELETGDMVLEDVMKSENGDLASSYLIS